MIWKNPESTCTPSVFGILWRRWRDSNSRDRFAVYTISNLSDQIITQVHLSSSQTFSGHLGLLKALIILHLFGHLRLRDVKHVSV